VSFARVARSDSAAPVDGISSVQRGTIPCPTRTQRYIICAKKTEANRRVPISVARCTVRVTTVPPSFGDASFA
jgi:hypothetical protein